jgi:phage-related protein
MAHEAHTLCRYLHSHASIDILMIVDPRGVYEIRVRDASGAYRAMYVAKFEAAVYVLHAFQKKTRQTAKTDVELGKARYRMIGGKP